jgi:hypothetical protein
MNSSLLESRLFIVEMTLEISKEMSPIFEFLIQSIHVRKNIFNNREKTVSVGDMRHTTFFSLRRPVSLFYHLLFNDVC